MESSSKKILAFFVIFLPKISPQSLKIPSAFTLHMEGRIPKKAFLRNRHGMCWPVEVTKIRDDFYFHEGWVKFVKDNALNIGDFMVFHYDGGIQFDVKLFDETNCEKEEKEDKAVVEDLNEADSYDDDDDDDDGEDGYEYDIDYIDLEEEEEEEEEDEEGEEDDGDGYSEAIQGITEELHVNAGSLTKGNSVTRVDNEIDEDEIFRSGLIPRPKNPYFVTKIRQKRKSELYIPVDVIRDHKIKLHSSLFLVDQQRRGWDSRVSIWKDGRIWLTGGWNSLCRCNHLQKEDRVICEFMPAKGRRSTFLLVHILRAGSW